MGVEQLYTDYFQRAKEYGERWVNYNGLERKIKSKTPKPRYDIEMEVLVVVSGVATPWNTSNSNKRL